MRYKSKRRSSRRGSKRRGKSRVKRTYNIPRGGIMIT